METILLPAKPQNIIIRQSRYWRPYKNGCQHPSSLHFSASHFLPPLSYFPHTPFSFIYHNATLSPWLLASNRYHLCFLPLLFSFHKNPCQCSIFHFTKFNSTQYDLLVLFRKLDAMLIESGNVCVNVTRHTTCISRFVPKKFVCSQVPTISI